MDSTYNLGNAVNLPYQLKGNFKTTSTTLEAIEINSNNNSSDRIFFQGSIVTGGGYSIAAPAGLPVSITVLPNSTANTAPDPLVTILGSPLNISPAFKY